MRRLTAILSFVMLLAIGCSRPSSYEQFVRTGARGEDGLYHYRLEMDDSTSTYDLSFYSRIDCNNLKIATLGDFPLVVTWISPSGTKYSEKVFFNIHNYLPGSDFYSHQYRFPYRVGMAPVEWGEWEMTVRIDAESLIPGFRGLGVVLAKHSDEDGS